MDIILKKYRRSIMVLILIGTILLLTGCNDNESLKNSNNWVTKFISLPLAQIMNFFMEMFNDFGWTMLIVLLIVRFATWPIYSSMNTMSTKMTLAQPEIQRMKEKYIGKNDPDSRRRMQMEQMQIMKKYNINMLGCLAPLIQFPLFIGAFMAIKRFGITFTKYENSVKWMGMNLDGYAKNGDVVGWVLLIIMLIFQYLTMYIMQKKPAIAQSKKYQTEQSQQMQQQMKIMYIVMLGTMGWFAYGAPASIALYWTFGSIFSIAQNLINKATMEKRMEKIKGKIK